MCSAPIFIGYLIYEEAEATLETLVALYTSSILRSDSIKIQLTVYNSLKAAIFKTTFSQV